MTESEERIIGAHDFAVSEFLKLEAAFFRYAFHRAGTKEDSPLEIEPGNLLNVFFVFGEGLENAGRKGFDILFLGLDPVDIGDKRACKQHCGIAAGHG